MSPSNLLELAIIAFIVFGIAVAIWKGGARNPVGTGGLDKKLAQLGSDLAGVNTKVVHIEKRIDEIERDTASTKDIARLEKSIEKLAKTLPDLESRLRAQAEKQGEHAATSASTATAVQHLVKQVDLIMSVVVPKGMEK